MNNNKPRIANTIVLNDHKQVNSPQQALQLGRHPEASPASEILRELPSLPNAHGEPTGLINKANWLDQQSRLV